MASLKDKDPEKGVFLTYWGSAVVLILLVHWFKIVSPTVGFILLMGGFVVQILLRCYLVSVHRRKLEAEAQFSSAQQSSNP